MSATLPPHRSAMIAAKTFSKLLSSESFLNLNKLPLEIMIQKEINRTLLQNYALFLAQSLSVSGVVEWVYTPENDPRPSEAADTKAFIKRQSADPSNVFFNYAVLAKDFAPVPSGFKSIPFGNETSSALLIQLLAFPKNSAVYNEVFARPSSTISFEQLANASCFMSVSIDRRVGPLSDPFKYYNAPAEIQEEDALYFEDLLSGAIVLAKNTNVNAIEKLPQANTQTATFSDSTSLSNRNTTIAIVAGTALIVGLMVLLARRRS